MITIGLSGPLSSGKTTIAGLLAEDLSADVLCLDDYFKKSYYKVLVSKYAGFERPELYDGERLAENVRELCGKGSVVCRLLNLQEGKKEEKRLMRKDYLIVKGLILYIYPGLREVLDYKFYLDIAEHEVVKRMKQNRNSSFLDIELSKYDHYANYQKKLQGVVVLDAVKQPVQLRNEILTIVNP